MAQYEEAFLGKGGQQFTIRNAVEGDAEALIAYMRYVDRETSFLEGWCRGQGIEKLCLEVDTRNTRALGLYLSLGFVVEGTLRHSAKLADGTYRDYYAMGKFL